MRLFVHKIVIIFYPFVLKCVLGTQKILLIKMVLLNTQNNYLIET